METHGPREGGSVPNAEAQVDALSATLLAKNWNLMSASEQESALYVARLVGQSFAVEQRCRQPTFDNYVKSAVWWAFDEVKVINDVDYALWESGDPEDPWVVAWKPGCDSKRVEG